MLLEELADVVCGRLEGQVFHQELVRLEVFIIYDIMGVLGLTFLQQLVFLGG